MASISPALNAYCAVQYRLRRASINSRKFSLSLPLVRGSVRKNPSPFFSKFRGSFLQINRVCLRQNSFGAVAGETTAIPYDSTEDHVSPTEESDISSNSVFDMTDDRGRDGKDAIDGSKDHKMTRVCNKLIDVFMVDKPTPADWRKLLTFSREWNNIRPHFYKHCQERADNESDPGMKHKLLKLARKLKEVDEDVQRHNELLESIRKSPSKIDEIVAKRRKDFTDEFFVHIFTVAQSYYDNPEEQEAVAELGTMSFAAVEAYDTETGNREAMDAAERKLEDIVSSPSLGDACRKIDDLAEKNQLDSRLLVMLAKAYSASRETDMVKDDAKDALYHLYQQARVSLQKQMPADVRILKYLLTIEDPEERMSTLREAFTPGENLESTDIEYLYTTPERLHTLLRTVVDAYYSSKGGTVVREARDLMSPKTIQRLEELKKLVENNFM